MNYVSLGYVCAIARELERLGLRNSSMPFDWNVTDFKGVIEAIRNNFDDYLDYNLLEQEDMCRKHYRNPKYNVQFYHDFNYFEPLDKQLPKVQSKYERRIKRFYEIIKQPTTFIRYISDDRNIDGKSKELLWIEENYTYIYETLRYFNCNNDIIFIANEGVVSSKVKIYNVKRDGDYEITNTPITNNHNMELKKLFSNKVGSSDKNIIRLNRKKVRLVKLLSNLTSIYFISKSIKFCIYRVFSKQYSHSKKY